MAETKLGKDAITFPVGTTAQRPANPEAGMIRWNTDADALEGYDGVEWAPISPAPGSTVNVEYRPSQSMGRKFMSSGSGGTFFDETCCPLPYTTVQANSKIIWHFSIVGAVDRTHIAAYGQFSIDDGSNWIDAQQFSGTHVQGAWAFSWQTNDNNADTHASYALIPGSSYSSGTQIKFRMAFYSPQQYDVSLGGSNSDWRSLQYARGQHVIMEIAE